MEGSSKSKEIKFFQKLDLSLECPHAEDKWIVTRGGQKLEPTFNSKAAAVRHWERELLQLAQSHHFFETLKGKAKGWKREEIEPIIAWLESPGTAYPSALSKMQGVAFEPTIQWRRKASKIYRDLGAVATDAERMLRAKTATILREHEANLGEKQCSKPKEEAKQSDPKSKSEGLNSI
ncbi:hypothetical protein [Xanthomonas axonopodis]|uniref:hypothetical protein n=1 Tax=Xanthomonas axonopodis TaxID=53413 RepID=UPI001117180A|nr:hypothetical protein [Xanthomonas axonopodis]